MVSGAMITMREKSQAFGVIWRTLVESSHSQQKNFIIWDNRLTLGPYKARFVGIVARSTYFFPFEGLGSILVVEKVPPPRRIQPTRSFRPTAFCKLIDSIHAIALQTESLADSSRSSRD